MISKDLIERMINKVNDCIPDKLKDCKSDFSNQLHDILAKVLAEFHVVTQEEFQAQLTLLKDLEAQIKGFEKRVEDMEKELHASKKK